MAEVALFISLYSYFPKLLSASKEELADYYCERVSKRASKYNFSQEDLPYVKALLRMKCRDFDLSLMDRYRKSVDLKSDLFSEKSLLERFYEK